MSSTWYQDFLENGFAVIPKVISESKAAQYQQAAFDWLKSFDNPRPRPFRSPVMDTSEPSIRINHQHLQPLRCSAQAFHLGHPARVEHHRRIRPTLANLRAPRLFRRFKHHPPSPSRPRPESALAARRSIALPYRPSVHPRDCKLV
jgi:hypothetical protein